MSAPSELVYARATGLQNDLSVDDLAVYFQKQRCGGGVVREVIFLGQYKTSALVGIEGVVEKGIDKLFKGKHSIYGQTIKVERGQPTEKEKAMAIVPSSVPSLEIASLSLSPEPHQPLVSSPAEPQSFPSGYNASAPQTFHHGTQPGRSSGVSAPPPVAPPTKLFYIKASGLQSNPSVDDMAAYFQKQRCGGGVVREVIWWGYDRKVAVVGIEGLDGKAIAKLLKGQHSMYGKVVHVIKADFPSEAQRARAEYPSTLEAFSLSQSSQDDRLPNRSSSVSGAERVEPSHYNAPQSHPDHPAEPRRSDDMPQFSSSSPKKQAQNLFYVKAAGMKYHISVDDVATYFQRQRCGGGVVHEVIWLNESHATAIVGIEGLDSKSVAKLLKGKHELCNKVFHVTKAGYPTEKQRSMAEHPTMLGAYSLSQSQPECEDPDRSISQGSRNEPSKVPAKQGYTLNQPTTESHSPLQGGGTSITTVGPPGARAQSSGSMAPSHQPPHPHIQGSLFQDEISSRPGAVVGVQHHVDQYTAVSHRCNPSHPQMPHQSVQRQPVPSDLNIFEAAQLPHQPAPQQGYPYSRYPSHIGQGGPSHIGQGGPSHMAPGGPSHIAPGGPSHIGQGGPSHIGQGGPSHIGQGDPSHMAPGDPSHIGQGGPSHIGQGDPSHIAPGGPSHMAPGQSTQYYYNLSQSQSDNEGAYPIMNPQAPGDPSHIGQGGPSHIGQGDPSHIAPGGPSHMAPGQSTQYYYNLSQSQSDNEGAYPIMNPQDESFALLDLSQNQESHKERNQSSSHLQDSAYGTTTTVTSAAALPPPDEWPDLTSEDTTVPVVGPTPAATDEQGLPQQESGGPPLSKPHPQGAPLQYQGTPPHLQGTPPHLQGTPPHLQGTPPHLQGTPPHLQGTPPHLQGTPPHLQGTPPHLQGTPPHLQGTVIQPQVAPLQPQCTPLQPQGTPLQPQGTPLQPQGTPLQPQGTPLQPQGTPLQPQGTPLQPRGTPLQPRGTPLHPQGTPLQPRGTPLQPQGTPLQPQGTPLQPQGVTTNENLPVLVEGIPGPVKWSDPKSYLELAFDDESKGGGDIEDGGIVIKGSTALITFKDPQVAQRVVARNVWDTMGVPLRVSFPQRKRDPLEQVILECNQTNTIVLGNIPNGVEDDLLTLYIESTTGLEEKEYKLHFQGREEALLILSSKRRAEHECDLISQKLQKPKKLLKKEKLRVAKLEEVKSVLLSGIKDESLKEDFLKLYFSNRKKSGGSDVTKVSLTGRGEAIVTFKDPNTVRCVLDKMHTSLGEDVTTVMYHPVLSKWFTGTTPKGRPGRSQSKHSHFTINLTKTLAQHVEKCDLIKLLTDQLSKECAEVKLNKAAPSLTVTPKSGSEWNAKWEQICRAMVMQYVKKFREELIKIPKEVAGTVFPVILANVLNPNVSVSLADSHDKVVLVGLAEDVHSLKGKIEGIIHENLDTVKPIMLPPQVLILIDKCIRNQLEQDHKSVLFKVNLEESSVQLSGKAAGCELFEKAITKLNPHVIDVHLPPEAVLLLSLPHGRQLLHSKIRSKPISFFFTDEHGEVPKSDISSIHHLHLVSEKKHAAMTIGITKDLQDSIIVKDFNVPIEFKFTVQLESWGSLKKNLEQKFIARLLPKPSEKKVTIICEQLNEGELIQQMKDFVHNECFKKDIIKLQRGQWQYMKRHSEEWGRLAMKMEDAHMEAVLPQNGAQLPQIILKGETTPVNNFAAEIRRIRDGIVNERKEVVRAGVVKHFLSKAGDLQVKGIEAEQKAVVEISTKDEMDKQDQVAHSDGPMHKVVCSGTTAESARVKIMKGDLLEYKVDVLVNAANEELNHSGGIAGLILRKGGQVIQEESTQYINRSGRLEVGDAVLLKSVGNLNCKAIVHTVGPRWNHGAANEEAYLAKSVKESLKAAQQYSSIAFPAISTGIFGVPAPVSAKAMLTGIRDFYRDYPGVPLNDVVIMIFQDNHVRSFADEAKRQLEQASEPTEDMSFSSKPVAATPMDYSSAVTSSLPATSTGPRRPSLSSHGVVAHHAIKLKRGALTNYQADVYVNSASQDLDLKHGAIAASLLKAGGRRLQDECTRIAQQRRGGEISHWDIATTGGGHLSCRNVVHTVGANYRKGSSEKQMENMIRKVMVECDRLRATSVAFPALGTGNLGFPEHVVAKLMVQTISNYLNQNHRSSIGEVLLVIFMDSTYREFQKVVDPAADARDPPSTRAPARRPQTSYVGDFGDEESYSEAEGSHLAPPPEAETLQSFECNRVRIDITQGDITEDDSEGLVCTSTDDLTLQDFGVMGAFKKKGGSKLQDECHEIVQKQGKLRTGRVLITGPGNGSLKCRRIIHVLAPPSHDPGDLERTVSAVFKMAETFQLRSVALPAIGTGAHGLSPSEVAGAICEAIVDFSKTAHQYVQHIKIILFQPEMCATFSGAFSQAGRARGIQKVVNAVKGFFGYGTKGTAPLREISTNVPAPVYTSAGPVTRDTVLVISIYASSASVVGLVMKNVTAIIEDLYRQEEIHDEKISKLATRAIRRLEGLAVDHHVKITIDKAPINSVKLKGDKTDVEKMKQCVKDELQNIEKEEGRIKEAEMMKNAIQWQWKDDKGKFQDYEPMLNLEIEEAYKRGDGVIKIDTEEGRRKINFKKQTETGESPPFDSTDIKRRDFEQERKEDLHPSTWDPMPTDSNGKEVTCHVVELDSNSKEFREVEGKFNNTMQHGTIMRGMLLPHQGIRKIERIQNPALYSQYVARKKAMKLKNPDLEVEKRLFHGCASDTVDKINHGGFNRSYAGKNATYYGNGTYFAMEANLSASDTYSPPDGNGVKHMYLARVLAGEFTAGGRGLIVPPAKDTSNPSDLYDSVVDNVANPTIVVIFHDAQTYPDYHIEF